MPDVVVPRLRLIFRIATTMVDYVMEETVCNTKWICECGIIAEYLQLPRVMFRKFLLHD
jgi:hypothetical protein